MHLSVKKDGDVLTVRAEADGFLYNMVRIIVGTLVYVGNGKLKSEEIAELMNKNVIYPILFCSYNGLLS